MGHVQVNGPWSQISASIMPAFCLRWLPKEHVLSPCLSLGSNLIMLHFFGKIRNRFEKAMLQVHLEGDCVSGATSVQSKWFSNSRDKSKDYHHRSSAKIILSLKVGSELCLIVHQLLSESEKKSLYLEARENNTAPKPGMCWALQKLFLSVTHYYRGF